MATIKGTHTVGEVGKNYSHVLKKLQSIIVITAQKIALFLRTKQSTSHLKFGLLLFVCVCVCVVPVFKTNFKPSYLNLQIYVQIVYDQSQLRFWLGHMAGVFRC